MGMTDLRVETLPHRGRVAFAKALADLRTDYFSEYPYLQTPDHKAALQEMRSLCMDPEVLIVAAFDDGAIAGCGIVRPFRHAEVARCGSWFAQRGYDIRRWTFGLYTLTRPQYRALGVTSMIGNLLNREFRSRAIEGRVAPVIQRQASDIKAPPGYRDPLGFFLKRGYEQMDIPSLTASWRDIGDDHETEKHYVFVARKVETDA